MECYVCVRGGVLCVRSGVLRMCEGWSAVEGVECCVRGGVLWKGWSAV